MNKQRPNRPHFKSSGAGKRHGKPERGQSVEGAYQGSGFNRDKRHKESARPQFGKKDDRKFGQKKDRKFGQKPGQKPHGKPFSKSFAKPQAPETAPAPRKLRAQQLGHLLYGLHAVQEAWLNPQRVCHHLWLTEQAQKEFAPTLDEARSRDLARPQPKIATKHELDQLLPGSVHQGIALELNPLPELTLDDLLAREPRMLVMLDQVTDPHNVGAIMRSAAAFGAHGLIVTERNAPGATGVMAKTASGALEHVPLVHVVNLARALDVLRQEGYWCVGLAEEGKKTLDEHDLTGKTVIVLGAEGSGLRRLTRERCDDLAKLPTQPPIGSLNVSNAAAVALYEIKRQVKP